ncbi:hypothetical protein NW766_001607 [Fusarium irregulare]|uniref:Uncharacterized protein n=1 Tax=Fusarium irregulare TaxID=2494466 RepID=A0A9W8PYZ3_9HYPO|nr:hypothetical protein NW766_001607 [Fusarium irregulare]
MRSTDGKGDEHFLNRYFIGGNQQLFFQGSPGVQKGVVLTMCISGSRRSHDEPAWDVAQRNSLQARAPKDEYSDGCIGAYLPKGERLQSGQFFFVAHLSEFFFESQPGASFD